MIDWCYNILRKLKLTGTHYYGLIYKILKGYVNLFFPLIYRYKNPIYRKSELILNEEIIVSLTSFPARINTVWHTAYTLLCQSLKPTKVILWLADTEFKAVEELPRSLKRLIPYGIDIRFCDNLMSHKKYYYAMKEFPDAIIITVDDDVYYPSFLIENLYRKHMEFPDAICCNWAHIVKLDEGRITMYEEWEHAVSGHSNNPSHSVVQIGCQGVLYPAYCLNELVFDKELIWKLCPTADDLWLKAMAFLNGTKVVRCDEIAFRYIEIIASQKEALDKINNGEKQNDAAIKRIVQYFPEIEMNTSDGSI